jgi:hypothetical protein
VLIEASVGNAVAETSLPEEIAWRVFTKGIDFGSAQSQTSLSGDKELALHLLRMISIVG